MNCVAYRSVPHKHKNITSTRGTPEVMSMGRGVAAADINETLY